MDGTMVSGADSRKASPVRSAIEIAILLAYLFLFPSYLERLFVVAGLPVNGFTQVAAIAGLYVIFVLLVVAMLKLRGEGVTDIGLRRPKSWPIAILIGTGLAALTCATVEILERSGLWARDVSEV